MNHFAKFYPLGNADTTLIKLNSGKTILIDYANTRNGDNDDRRCDLPVELNKDVTENYLDVVAFTHGDIDHLKRFSEYFYLEHTVKYQVGVRKKIIDLWVPAHVILEEGCEDETRVLRAEARHRLSNKKGVKVFANPEKLRDWLTNEGIVFDDVKHLIVNAGQTVPGWGPENLELEFFVHAPFSYSHDDTEVNRNDVCLILQATFRNQYATSLLLLGDATWELLHEIVALSERFGNEHRLTWDIVHLAHHCSYLSLGPEKGELVTHPVAPVKKLFEEYSRKGCLIISPSCPIPGEYDNILPPHRQAYNYYKAVAEVKEGEIKATMEFPDQENPRTIEIVINEYGATLLKTIVPAGFVFESKPPKAG